MPDTTSIDSYEMVYLNFSTGQCHCRFRSGNEDAAGPGHAARGEAGCGTPCYSPALGPQASAASVPGSHGHRRMQGGPMFPQERSPVQFRDLKVAKAPGPWSLR